MKTIFALSVASLSLLAAACSGSVSSDASSSADIRSNGNVDSIGCGDGKTSAPNAWFIDAKKTSDKLFEEVALMSSNQFNVDIVTPVNTDTEAGSLVFPENINHVTQLTFVVDFTPGVDSVSLPTIHADSIAYRDTTLKKLKSLGVEIGCNNILHGTPLTAAKSSNAQSTASENVDSLGCGDGTVSAPNAWFMTVDKSSSPLFKEIALMSSSLFWVDSLVAINSEAQDGSLAYPEKISDVTDLSFIVDFTPAANSVSETNEENVSIANRNKVLTELVGLGLDVECNEIGHVEPLTK